MRYCTILIVALTLLIQPARAEEEKSVAAGLATDIIVTIRHTDGSVEEFSNEVAALEIIVAPNSMIEYIHLILVGGSEKDTHYWYNFNQLAGFKYQFKAITGKGKVKLKQLDQFVTTPKTGLQSSIKLVEADDFK